MSNALKTCYGWLAFLAMVLGLVLGVVFVLAIAVGGRTAVSLSAFGSSLMPWCIGTAALATLAGLLGMYTAREHTLTVSAGSGDQAEERTDADSAA